MATPSNTKVPRVRLEGGKRLHNKAKAKAAEHGMLLQEYVGKVLEFAVNNDAIVFAAHSCHDRDNSVNKS